MLLAPLASLSVSEYKGGRLEDGSSFGRQLLECEVLGSEEFAVTSECGPFFRGDSSLRLDELLDTWRDFPLLTKEGFVVGICALWDNLYDCALLFDARVDINCEVILFCMFFSLGWK
jgi:hypothetical protein